MSWGPSLVSLISICALHKDSHSFETLTFQKFHLCVLFDQQSIKKSTMNILSCIQKGSTKHHKPLFYSLAMKQYVVCVAGVSLRERKKLVDAHAFILFSRK